jgi:hypothetical protein
MSAAETLPLNKLTIRNMIQTQRIYYGWNWVYLNYWWHELTQLKAKILDLMYSAYRNALFQQNVNSLPWWRVWRTRTKNSITAYMKLACLSARARRYVKIRQKPECPAMGTNGVDRSTWDRSRGRVTATAIQSVPFHLFTATYVRAFLQKVTGGHHWLTYNQLAMVIEP